MSLLLSAIYNETSPLDSLFDTKAVVLHAYQLDSSPVVDVAKKALVLWGGEDISPSLYGQRKAPQTGADAFMSLRDRIEYSLMKEAIKMKIPIIGICRGAQLACAIAGGTLIQHVSDHAGSNHPMVDQKDVVIETNSVHHQMMNPYETEHELIAWAAPKRSRTYVGEGGLTYIPAYEADFKEPEVVYFPTIKTLAIQGHPEFASATKEFIKYINDLIVQYLLEPLNETKSG